MTERRKPYQAAASGPPTKPCFRIQQGLPCKFGARCKYSHDVTPGSLAPGRQQAGPSRAYQPQEARNGKFQQWKRMMDNGPGVRLPSSQEVGQFFQLALDLIGGDVGVSQEVIKLLATDPGLAFVRDIADRHVREAYSDRPTAAFWTVEVKPFFELITHPRVIDSAVLEQQVATTFNFLCGHGGIRMKRLFGYVGQLVKSWPANVESKTSRTSVVELALAVLTKILDCNTSNVVNQNFLPLMEIFSESLEDEPQPEDEFSRLQALKYLEYMRRRLEVGSEMSDWQAISAIDPVREQFVLRRDLPGHLSAEGRRHDNDHAEIDKIKILPTYEEIVSIRQEYLPTTDSSQWHITGIRGRLDREFRLLREDTVGQVRDAVHLALKRIRSPSTTLHANPNSRARTYTYDDALPINTRIYKLNGLELTVQCVQPVAVEDLSARERKDWWSQSKRLQPGALVCLVDGNGSVLFCAVSKSTLRGKVDVDDSTTDSDSDDSASEARPEPRTISDDPEFLYVQLQLIDASDRDVTEALHWYSESTSRYLVEFPGVLLASFKHTLEALQRMYQKLDIPFANLLVSSGDEDPSPEAEIKPPLYARKAGRTFNMACLCTDPGDELVVSAHSLPAPKDLVARSTLDLTQSAALLNTLSRELSLIQGPPGTGKSYTGEKIIKVLLANKKQTKIGPILCVCYTNHALDQLLEHLLEEGVTKVIRIGSRSKSEMLQDLNLHVVVQGLDRTKAERTGLYHAYRDMDDLRGTMEISLGQLREAGSWKSVKHFLSNHELSHYDDLFGESDDEDGWTTVNRPEKMLKKWLTSGAKSAHPRPVEDLKSVPLWTMRREERKAIHDHWIQSIRDTIVSDIKKSYLRYNVIAANAARLRSDVDLRCLSEADVVGVTTTGLARNLDLLRRLRCKVMLCEEAGEVLEAHFLATLLPSLEHVILVGDHLQLRPHIHNYELQSMNPRGKQYSLDMSLFERLVQPPHLADRQVPYSTLGTQRRMHPAISELVRSTLYPQLEDSESVAKYPEVVGVKERLFWLHHEDLEAAAAKHDPLNTSHWNEFEVEMTAALVSYLVRQGEYTRGDIAVITPYLGQLHRLRQRMQSMFEICVNESDLADLEDIEAGSQSDKGAPRAVRQKAQKTTLLKSIRVATVDNFQGEEAKIVVISLVRSNVENRCGFLSTPNRINVLLSRAKHGMYIIGNSNTYKGVPMWADVIDILQGASRLGRSLELHCPRHPDQGCSVSRTDHFLQYTPESGCNLPCDKRLSCGHSCTGRCHSDVLHNAVKCLEKCPRPKSGCEHPCPRPCGEECEEYCNVLLDAIEIVLPCGHILSSAECWEVQDLDSVICMEQVTKTVPGCNHQVKVRCHEDVFKNGYRCVAQCLANRDCGHECKSACFQCSTRKDGDLTGQNHGICSIKCGRKFASCPHSCPDKCHDGESCPPCSKPCEVRCSHSRCAKPCHEPCAPCAEEACQSRCPHAQCTMPCAAPCNWVPCSMRCEKKLSCGHQCPSLCGEDCPDAAYCQKCGSKKVKRACVDFLEMKEYRKIDLDKEPCIFPQCGHFLTVASMDGQMDMANHYQMDEQGRPVKIKASLQPFSMEESDIKACPTCRGSLRNISRYGRIVRRAMLDEATKKFIIWSHAKNLSLEKKLLDEQEKLAALPAPMVFLPLGHGSKSVVKFTLRQRQLQYLQSRVGKKRYEGIIGLWRAINSYAREVRKEEQPFHRVAELVQHSNRQNRTRLEFVYDEDVVQVKGYLVAAGLLLKCDIAIYLDFLALRHKLPRTDDDVVMDFGPRWSDCHELIELAQKTIRPREKAQGHIFAARLGGLCLAFESYPSALADKGQAADASEQVTKTARKHLAKARQLVTDNPSMAALESEMDAAEAMLNGEHYRPASAAEMRAVYEAMAQEFRGTGHWYTCTNGHPFTIGECGTPVEQARCPECNAPIGGRNHQTAEGVRRVDDIEGLIGGMRNMDLDG